MTYVFAPAGGNTAPLFPSRAARLQCDDHLTTLLEDAAQQILRGPVTPSINMEIFRGTLAGFTFEQPVELETLLGWTVAQMQAGLVHLNHPRYLGLFNPAPTYPAKCADRITAVFNPQLASATTSPAAVEIEAHVIRAVASRAGLGPAATGHFTSGGSEANGTALICALTAAEPGFAAAGARAYPGQPVFYTSADCHLAWIKIAHQAGIGRDAARLIATEPDGRMSISTLTSAIAADRAAGCIPFMVAATAGTTNAGMVDPLPECAAITRRENLWYHVDAAWGGGLIAVPAQKVRLAGMEQADSITIDAHKWFATTMGCGMILCARPECLAAAFNITASFMPSHTPSLDPYMSTAQWSRRFTGLRLFLSLAAGGWAAHAAHVEHSFAMTGLLATTMQDHGWILENPNSLAVACLTPPAGSPPVREIVARILASGEAWVSAASFNGRDVLRACVTNGETSASDIARAAAALQRARQN